MKWTAVIVALAVAVWPAPPNFARQSLYGAVPASAEERKPSCPPDWTRKTTSSGTQIGTGEPGGVPPVGCPR